MSVLDEVLKPGQLSPGSRNGFTQAEVDAFQTDGYLIARGLVQNETRTAMRSVVLRDLADRIEPLEYEADLKYPGAPASRDADGGQTVRRLKNAFARSPAFADWISGTPLITRLQQLLGPRVVMPLAHHNCVMTKQPAFSSETHWHQDIRYWSYTRPELVSVWLALGNELDENGCLWVIPGSHLGRYQRDQFDEALFFREDLPENQALLKSAVKVELAAGDVLFFHCRTFHAAGKNRTNEPKFSAVFTFRPLDNPPLEGSRSAGLPELLLR